MPATNSKIYSYKELIVWQKGIELVEEVYRITKIFPKDEIYGLVSQMRRVAVSIPSNIAEGRHRNTKKDFLHFLTIAFGSCAELETQITIAKRLSFGREIDYNEVDRLILEVMKMLKTIISKFKTKS